MPTKMLMTVEEYLRTSFEDGDREYVDGEVVERNMGEINHGGIQGFLAYLFWQMSAHLGLRVLTDIRIRINSTRYRIPDVAVWLTGDKVEGDEYGVPLFAPFLVIEIFSPEDRMSRVKPKMKEYLSLGVPWVWLINPNNGTAICYSQADPEGSPCDVLHTENPAIEIPLERVLKLQA